MASFEQDYFGQQGLNLSSPYFNGLCMILSKPEIYFVISSGKTSRFTLSWDKDKREGVVDGFGGHLRTDWWAQVTGFSQPALGRSANLGNKSTTVKGELTGVRGVLSCKFFHHVVSQKYPETEN